MESREMHQLQKLYIQETNRYLAGLKQGVAGDELDKQKERIKELSRLLDQRYHGGSDPSSNLRRHHD
ncbi:MAG: hypothetical protein JWP27_2713 [Flaviaesturariibacter sp.]|nr:hypothetical protein [Flaviaesturariibacter sp.]